MQKVYQATGGAQGGQYQQYPGRTPEEQQPQQGGTTSGPTVDEVD